MAIPAWLIPLLIFVAEVCVVTISTLRIIFVSRGYKVLAPIFGFFEIVLWLFAMSQIMKNLDDWRCFLAFAVGFSLGNYLGILIEKLLAMGTVIVRIITHRDAAALIDHLRAASFGVTTVPGQGATGKVLVVLTVAKRRQLPEIVSLIETHHPSAFYAVDDLQSASEGIFPTKARTGIMAPPLSLSSWMRSMMAAQKQAELAGQGERETDG